MEILQEIIKHSLKKEVPTCTDPLDNKQWAGWGFFIAYRLYLMVRKVRHKIDLIQETYKEDGSPTTTLEYEMEQFAKDSLKRFYGPAVFLGEESGGVFDPNAFVLVIDPIDGTRSFLSGFETYSITLSVIKERNPIFSLICSPASGDVFFRIGLEKSMLFQIPIGEKEWKIELREVLLPRQPNVLPILINIHPAVSIYSYLKGFFSAWEHKKIALLRSLSGSPSLLMAEAAKTGSFYINTWDKGPTKPYDLVPGLHIIDGAGCTAVLANGERINPWQHRGVFVIGPIGSRIEKVLELLRYEEEGKL